MAIVVGAGSATGRECALSLGAAGATVLCADAASPDWTATDLAVEGASTYSLAVDISDPASTERMAAVAYAELGGLDILVNCDDPGDVGEAVAWNRFSESDWDAIVSRHVRGVWLSCRAAVPYLKLKRSGRIVNFGSTAVAAGSPGHLPYVTAKSALLGLTRSLARELGQFGIAVNLVCPGFGKDTSGPALGRPATAAEVGASVVFLSGDGAEFITGQSWVVDGGLVFQ